MQRNYAGCILVTFSMMVGCGDAAPLNLDNASHEQQGIISGITSGPQDFPEVGGLISPLGLCTGVLIAPDVVLTAGHCVTEETPMSGGSAHLVTDMYNFNFSRSRSLSKRPPKDTYYVQGATLHPNYHCMQRIPLTAAQRSAWDILQTECAELLTDRESTQQCLKRLDRDTQAELGLILSDVADLALLWLDRPVKDVKPATVWRGEGGTVALLDHMHIAGYGMSVINDPTATADMRQGTTHGAEYNASEFRTLPPPDSQACFGDSGGPALQQVAGADGRRVMGIASRLHEGFGKTSSCDKGVIYTRVDAYATWIERAMVEACDQGLRSHCVNGGKLPDSQQGCAAAPAGVPFALVAFLGLLRRRPPLTTQV